MTRHKNNTIIVGEPGSYQYMLSALEDMLKGHPKTYEVFHAQKRLIEAGERIGLSKERMEQDWQSIKISKIEF